MGSLKVIPDRAPWGYGKPRRQFATAQKVGETLTANKGKSGTRAPEQTFEEVRYLKHLIQSATPVRVRLGNGEEVSGIIEYYDHSFIRLTRMNEPNLFIFKHDILYMIEEGS
jgi:sRNA-binding regulator protein Hfq